MQNKSGKRSYRSAKEIIDFELSLIAYEEEGLHVVYSPALDLFGYGATEREAEKSFSITLGEHIRYTTNKNTFLKDLKIHGWKILAKKHRKKVFAPPLGQMLKENDYFNEIFNEKDYTKYNEKVSVPVYA